MSFDKIDNNSYEQLRHNFVVASPPYSAAYEHKGYSLLRLIDANDAEVQCIYTLLLVLSNL